MTISLFFDRLNKIPLYFLLFLIPLLFLPFTQDVLDFPKQTLFFILVPLSLIGWLGKGITKGEFFLKENRILYLSLVLILFSFLFSSLFSLLPKFSFLGYQPEVVDNFLTLFLFLVFFFLIVNSFEQEKTFLSFLVILLASVVTAGIFNLFQIYKIFLLPFDFTKTPDFNTVGTTTSFAVLAAVLLPFSLALTFQAKKSSKPVLTIIAFLLFLNIVLLNSKIAWAGLIVAILVLFVLGFHIKQNKVEIGRLFLLIAGLVFSIFFYFFPVILPGFPSLLPEVFLNTTSELYIIKGVFNDRIKNMVFGTGPGTFIFDYSRYRSPLLNQTIFWGTRFLRGHSVFLDWVLTKGILGAVSLLFFYLLIICFFLKFLKEDSDKSFLMVKISLFAGTIGLIWVSFFYPFNFTLYFLLFLLTAGATLFFSQKTRKINTSSYFSTIFSNLVFIIIVVLSLILFIFQGRNYVAGIKYLNGFKAAQENDFDRAIGYLKKAIDLNPLSDLYWRDLSQFYLSKANQVLENPDLSPEEKRKLIDSLIFNGADAINRAVEIVPINVANWNTRGFFYRNLVGIQRADALSLASYQRAIELEPNSPFAWTEKGRVYILVAQTLAQKKEKEDTRTENLNLAIQSLNRAIELKQDYTPAHYLLAVAYDQKGEVDRAILKLEETKTLVPQDVNLAFQLGLLYWRKEETEKARKEFERVLTLSPDYSNARYMLGLVYDKKGEKEKAKEEFEKVFQLNPENEQLKKILENLKNGLPALEGIILPQSSLQEASIEVPK